MKSSLKAAIVLAVVSLSQAMALPPEPIVRYKLTGEVILANCNAQLADVHVRLTQPARSVTPKSRIVQANGLIRMPFEMAFTEPLEGTFVLKPTIRAGVCPGGGFLPTSRTVTRIPSGGLTFAYGVSPGEVRRIPARDLASQLNLVVGGTKMKLNNQGSQSSFIEVAGNRVNFAIPKVTIDIDCGTLCPDLGDAHFYVNDVNLRTADLDFDGPYFTLAFQFEDSGREIKGYHNRLGDNGAPDFQLDRAKLALSAVPKLTNSGGLTFSFFAPKLTADIESTGGCNVAGIDLCNKILGTDRKIQKGVEKAALDALNGSTVQAALSAALRQYLRFLGIEGTLINVRMDGGDVLLSIR
jgi:hypothetical protein